MASTSSPQTEELYPYPSGANPADSFALRLCATNYFAWKELMLRFLDSHKVSAFVDGTINPLKKPPPLWESTLLLEEELDTTEKKRQEDWNQQHMQQEGEAQSLADWVQERERKRREGEWEESLEEQERWQEWQRRKEWDQECESRRERMPERREEERKEREEYRIYMGWKRSDDLVRGWILATMVEELVPQVMNLVTAREVWIKLRKILTPTFQPSHLKPYDWTNQKRGQIQRQHRLLHRAILTADWLNIANFLDRNPDAVLEPITGCLETALIVAVRSAKRNDFVGHLLERMERMERMEMERMERMEMEMEMEMEWMERMERRELWLSNLEHSQLLEQKDISGATALHAAVDGGNLNAAKWLVEKNRRLTNIGDKYGTLPVHVAAGLGNREMVDLLLRGSTYELESKHKLLHYLASSGLYDIALKILEGNPELASMEPSPLVVMAQKRASFLSGTSLNLLERLIYYVIPLKLEDIANQPQRSNIDSIVEPPQRSDSESIVEPPQRRDSESIVEPPQRSDSENIVEPPQRRDSESIVEPPQRRDSESIVEPPQRSDSENIVEPPQRSDIESIEPVVSSSIFVVVRQILENLFWEVWEKLKEQFGKVKEPFWDVAKKLVPPIKSVRETKLLHNQALNLVKWLCHYLEETDSPNVAEILTESLRNATCVGIHEIVEEILDSFPSAIHLKSEKDQSIFHLAIVYRRENVFNLIYQMEEDRRAFLSMPDASTNNALHLAGNLTPQQHILLRASAAGAALQMQRELQWFKEVGKWMLPHAKEHMNADGKTPQEVFTETHKDLVKEGERWMKDTANSCSIVAALIMTIVFAAAITVPGGSFSDNGSDQKGLPIRLGGRAFTVFGISDALAMFSSSASLLMFLSILTCRYGEEDFRYSLPRRLIIGLVTLFLSIISMMVAFGATLKIVFGEKTAWLLYPVAALSCAPVALFVLWQFPLLYVMIKSTYFPGIFGKKSNRILY